MPTEPLIHWPDPLLEILGFLAAFLAAGAVGFRFAVLRRALRAPDAEERRVWQAAARRAAPIGLTGVLLGALRLGLALPAMAGRRHASIGTLFATNAPLDVQVAMILIGVIGFALAAAGRPAGWPLAALGVIGGALRSALFAQWARTVNPIHVLGGGLWIGTLLVLVVVGLPAALRGLPAGRRGAAVAELTHAFSPLALASAALLATFGAITAWLHLKVLRSLWTTPYGVTLIVKLCVVATVAGLGAWNWRRQRPRLGNDAAAESLGRSARAELIAAAFVLVITAILVSLPTPKLPGR